MRADLADVVGRVCGIHAQVMSSAELSLGLRVDGLTQRDVREAIWHDQTLTRTYGLRGTIHIFATTELPMWLAALRAITEPHVAKRAERQNLPAPKLRKLLNAFPDALEDRILTRSELAHELERRLGRWVTEQRFPAFGGTMPSWHLGLSVAAYAGILAFGPPRGSKVTYVRLPPQEPMDGEDAKREVLRRYVWAYGPTTHVEFARWFSTSAPEARQLFDDLSGELEEVDIEGWRAWRSRHAPLPPSKGGSSVHLLPPFDAYVVGCHPRAQLMPEDLVPAGIRTTGTAAPWHVLLLDGVVSGLWSRQRTGKRLTIRVDAYTQLNRLQKEGVADQADRIGRILDAPVDLEFGTVEQRGHL
jgi:hypothetical protein